MIINNYNNQPVLELKEGKLIVYKKLFYKLFEVNNIKAVKINKKYEISILYNKKVYTISLGEIKTEDLIKLETLINSLNDDKIAFYNENNTLKKKLYIFLCMFFWLMALINTFFEIPCEYALFVVGLGYLIGFLYLQFSKEYSYRIFYQNNCNKFVIFYGINKREDISLNDESYKIKFDSDKHKYLLKKNNKTVLSFNNGILYPAYYRESFNGLIKSKLDFE